MAAGRSAEAMLRPVANTWKPASASAMATPRPTPLLAPVTMAAGICLVYFKLSSKMRHWEQMLVLALLNMLLMAQQKPKIEISEVKATGCVRRAAESQCLLLETLDGTATYTFIVAPKPELNAV